MGPIVLARSPQSIDVHCPACNTSLRAPGETRGIEVRCPDCAHVFRVPSVSPSAEPPGDGSAPPVLSRDGKPASPQPETPGQPEQARSDSKEEAQVDAILTEYRTLREEMRLFLGFHRKDTQILIAALSILVSVFISKTALFDVQLLTLVIPSLIFVFHLMQIFNLHMVSAQAKACAMIEEKINQLLDGRLMEWESVWASKMVRGIASPLPFASAAILLFFLCLFVVFALQANEAYGPLTLIGHGLELTVMLTASIWWAIFETTWSTRTQRQP